MTRNNWYISFSYAFDVDGKNADEVYVPEDFDMTDRWTSFRLAII